MKTTPKPASAAADFHAVFGGISDIACRVGLISMAYDFGAPWSLSEQTPWHEIGSDSCRILLTMEAEERFCVLVADEEREGLRTFGDFMNLIHAKRREQLAANPFGIRARQVGRA